MDKEYIEKFAALTAQDIEERIRHGAAGYHRAPTFMFSPQQEVAAQQAIETSKPHSPGIVAPIGGAALGGITGAVILGSGLGAAAMKYGAGVGTILGAMAGAAAARLKEEKKAIPGIIRSMYQQNPSLVKQVRELSGKAQTADIIRERELHAQELEMAQATQIERAAQAEAEAKTNQALAGAAALSSVASSAANAYKYRSNDDMNKQAQIEAIHEHMVKEAAWDMASFRKGVQAGIQAIGSGFVTAGQAVGRAGKATGQAIGRAGKATGQAVGRAGKATGQYVYDRPYLAAGVGAGLGVGGTLGAQHILTEADLRGVEPWGGKPLRGREY